LTSELAQVHSAGELIIVNDYINWKADTMAKQFDIWHTTLKDALGRLRTGWFVFEDGHPGAPFATQEDAMRQANAIANIRAANGNVGKIVLHTADLTGC
jgi:hypothetical protein